jgi:basic membrane protein A
MRRHLWWLAALTTAAVIVAACASPGTTTAPSGGEPSAAPSVAPSEGAASEPPAADCAGTGTQGGADLQIPDVEEGKFNVAMVLIGPHDDGGWSQAHYEGLQYVCENVADSHVAYIELVPEGADSEQPRAQGL